MNTPISFMLQFEPQPPTVTHQEKKFGGVTKAGTPVFYPTPELARARALLTARLAKFAPEKPWTCPVSMTCVWVFRRAKSGRGAYMTKRPDTDNLQKMLKDVMTDVGFWKDDALVVRECVEKRQAPEGSWHGIAINLLDMTEQNMMEET